MIFSSNEFWQILLIGANPRSYDKATFNFFVSIIFGGLSNEFISFTLVGIGSRLHSCTIPLNKIFKSVTFLAIGPSTSKGDQPIPLLDVGTNPTDGRIPTILQKDAGVLKLPAKSEPIAKGTIKEAIDTAVPPLEAPQLFEIS